MKPLAELIGESPGIEAVREQVGRLLRRHSEARRVPPLLIQGETGTGKGLVARAVHREGPRAGGPFVDVNCAAIPETLLEAELFGFERGAFTDARQAKAGLFQTAHRGTIFLDEVGLLSEALQAKLLKVIEERSVRRLGSTRSEPVDVQIITASNEDLRTAARARRFREDLYHRLAVLTISLPPLRERGLDILLLAESFLARACADYSLPPKALAPDARTALMAYAWPGNVREVGNVIERVALLSEEPLVTADSLGLPGASPTVRRGEGGAASQPARALDHPEDMEPRRLLETLDETGWNISRAAARLGVSRNTLRYRIEKHGLRSGPASASPAHEPRLPASSAARDPDPVPIGPAPGAEEGRVSRGVRWERRRLAVLRAVVADASASGSPSEWSRALDLFADKVRSFGGRVEELGQTAVTGVFGVEAVEDAPRRAALAAVAIQKAAERSRDRDAQRPSLGIGLHAVLLRLGWVGDQALVDQDAKRELWPEVEALARRAGPGRVVVSGTAAPLLERRFDLVPLRDAAPEGAFQLLGRERPGLGPGGRMPRFVGRHQDLEMLRRRLADAAAGQGQVVGIVGEAGIGKSRLLHEFRESLPPGETTCLEGRSVSYGSAIPYLPILDILREACGIVEADHPEAMATKVRAALTALGMGADDAAPYLVHLLGLKEGGPGEGMQPLSVLSPEAVQSRTLEILRQMSLRLSRRRPLVLVVEDVHWIDRASEEYLASVVEGLAGSRVLLLATYRPGYRPSWLEKSYATQAALRPLSPEDSLAVVRSVLGDSEVPASLAQVLVDRAEGNPFFLEELAWAVAAPGDVRPTAVVPDTIHGVIMARTDRLAEEPRRILQLGSVIGREFSPRLLGRVWEGPAAPDLHLRELTRLEFLYEQTAGEEPVYVFKHALTQEVAYDSLLEPQRRTDHAAIGAALEALYAGRLDEVVEIVAHHFGRSGDDEKAVEYAILAAEKAQRRWATAEALSLFEAVVTRLGDMPDTEANRLRRIDAVLKQSELQFALGRHAEHVRALEGIRVLVDEAADPPRRAAWCCWTGFLGILTGARPEAAVAYCREATEIAAAGGFDEIRAFAEYCLAHASQVAGDLRGALEAGERALAIFEARRNVWWACRTLWGLHTAALYLGEWQRGLEYCRRALAHGQAVDDTRLKVVGWWRTGSTHIQRGDGAAGLRCCDEALALSPTPFDTVSVTVVRGYGLVKTGAVDAGIRDLEEGVAWFDRSHLRYARSMTALRLAEGYLRRGDGPRAWALLEEVLATSQELGYRHVEGVASRLMGECHLREDPAGAADRLETATRVLEEVGARDEVAKALAARAELRRASGDPSGARGLLEQALSIFEALGTLDEPARVRAALAALPSHTAG